jgi:hypothetical protein
LAESAGDKTEKATPHKRENERKEGNVFQSKEILICVTMIVSFFCFKLLYNLIEDTIVNTMKDFFGLIPTQVVITSDDAKSLLIRGLKAVAIAVMPLLLITGVVAIIVTFVQTRVLVNTKQLRPKFSRMDPIRGFKNLFSLILSPCYLQQIHNQPNTGSFSCGLPMFQSGITQNETLHHVNNSVIQIKSLVKFDALGCKWQHRLLLCGFFGLSGRILSIYFW